MTDTAFYADLAATAQELIDSFGGPAVLRRDGTAGYDPATGETIESPDIDSNITAVMFPVKDNLIDGSLIRVGDQQVYTGVQGITDEPLLTDKFLFNGKTYTIIECEPLAPAGVVVLYQMVVRR